jgi:hypothetical protein
VDEEGLDVVLAYPIPVSQLHAARTVAFLLDREGGLLDEALIAPGLAKGAVSVAVGSHGARAALVVALDAEVDGVHQATQQLRALMQRVSGGAIGEGHHRLARSALSPAPPKSPQQRLFPAATDLPSLDELRRFAHSYLTEEKLVMVQAQPPE